MSELLIKINADAKNAKQAFEEIKKQSADLQDVLKDVGAVSAVAFAATSAAIGYSIVKFNEAKAASDELTLALQNQGIYSADLAERYNTLADNISRKTGVDDDNIKSALASAQALIGQKEITQELAQATIDFAAAQKIDLASAFEIVGKGINGNTVFLKKNGIEIDDNLSKSERMAQITEKLTQRYGEQASAANIASGGLIGLRTAFSNVVEGVGERFAPLFASITGLLTKFFTALSGNKFLLDLAAAFLAAAAAISGIIAGVAGLALVFLTLSAAATALGIALNVAFLGIPLVIGAVVAALVLLARNWDSVTQFIRSLVSGFVTFVKQAFGGIGDIIGGIFDLNPARISRGLDQIKNSLKEGANAYRQTYKEIELETQKTEEVQNEIKKKSADKAENERNAKEAKEKAALVAAREARIAELQLEAPKIVDILKQQAELKKSLIEEDNRAVIDATRARLAQLETLEAEARAAEVERSAAFQEEKRAFEADQLAQDSAARAELTQAQQQELEQRLLIEKEIEQKIEVEKLQTRIDARNKELEDRKKYGVTIAAINKVLGSEEVQGAKAAAGELVQLQQSKSGELKAIGKAAAVAQIAIATAESAMNIYRGFSTIPIIGPALGVAGAAAAVAFGAERTGNVLAAATGGLVEGGIPGRDSVPALLEPGELVVPRKNFNDVVGAAAGTGENRDAEIIDQLTQMNEKLKQPSQTIIQGDILSDESYIDRLIDKISNRLEFGNAKLFGVTS